MTREELERLRVQIQELSILAIEMQAIYSREVDIHTVTRQLGAFARRFIEVEEQFKPYLDLSFPPKNLSVALISDNIRAICPAESLATVNRVLGSIAGASGNEAETGASIQYLFIRIWDLLDVYSNAIDLVLDNLQHNIDTGGGCDAGIAARLIQPYTAFLLEALRKTHAKYTRVLLTSPKPVIFSAAAKAEEDLQLALAASLADQQQPKPTAPPKPKTSYEEELELALARSRLEM